jgi:NTE family protein/lysophospholipid hydrolase
MHAMNIKQEPQSNLSRFLSECPLFNGLDSGQLNEVARLLERTSYTAGDIIIAQEGAEECLYIVHKGQLKTVSQNPDGEEIHLDNTTVRGTIGEIALLTGAQPTATVYATEATELLCLNKDNFEGLKERYPETAAQIAQNIVQKQYRVLLDMTLRISNLLQHVDGSIIQDLLDLLEITLLTSTKTLVREGEESDSLYIVISGRLRVVINNEDGKESILLELGRGETVGEAGLITGERRSATVYAVRDTVLARLSRDAFNQLLVKHPQAMMQQFAATVINRLQGQVKGTVGPGKRLASLAFVPLTPDVPLKSLVKLLAEQLGHLDTTLHLDSAALAQALRQDGIAQTGTDDPANINIVSWLAEQETQYRYIVYEADDSFSLWTQRCLRQADHVVLVANANTTPALTAIESDIAAFYTNSNPDALSLVLLHPPDTVQPTGTTQWLAARQVGHHYHVKQENSADIARLARLLTGQGIGLVLSGGGARGYAHIGALRALREAGIPIDLIGGSSQGGLMACQFAMGWDFPTIMARNKSALKYKFDYTFPFTSLMAGGEMTQAVQEIFGDTALEDMWLPCFCTTTNLTTAELMVHTQGPAWKYTRATTSLPGILPPVMDGDNMLIDGGVLNNLPIDIMRQRSDVGVVFASDVSDTKRRSQQSKPPYDTYLSGWQVMWRRLNPLTESMNVPSMGEIMMQTAVLSNSQTANATRKLADFYMRLSVREFGMLEFERLETIVAKGYESAQQQVALWKNNELFQNLAISGARTSLSAGVAGKDARAPNSEQFSHDRNR